MGVSYQFAGGYAAARAALIAYVDVLVPEEVVMVSVERHDTDVCGTAVLLDGTRLVSLQPMLTLETIPISRLRTMAQDMAEQLAQLREESPVASEIEEVLRPMDERPDVVGLGGLRILETISRLRRNRIVFRI